MKTLKRLAFVGAAALAGAFGLVGLQSRAIARANVETVRQNDSRGVPSSQSPVTATVRNAERVRGFHLATGNAVSYGHEVWIGRMRSGSRSGGVWRVGRRGGNRLRGRGVRV